jgi:hypothetical protein
VNWETRNQELQEFRSYRVREIEVYCIPQRRSPSSGRQKMAAITQDAQTADTGWKPVLLCFPDGERGLRGEIKRAKQLAIVIDAGIFRCQKFITVKNRVCSCE